MKHFYSGGGVMKTLREMLKTHSLFCTKKKILFIFEKYKKKS
jgi:hypothetical protein